MLEQEWKDQVEDEEEVVFLSSPDSSISNLEVFSYARYGIYYYLWFISLLILIMSHPLLCLHHTCLTDAFGDDLHTMHSMEHHKKFSKFLHVYCSSFVSDLSSGGWGFPTCAGSSHCSLLTLETHLLMCFQNLPSCSFCCNVFFVMWQFLFPSGRCKESVSCAWWSKDMNPHPHPHPSPH